MTHWLHIAVICWAVAGLAFWIDCLRWSGLPDRWSSRPRDTGWGEMLLAWLPLMILGGPLWWLALGFFRWRDDD